MTQAATVFGRLPPHREYPDFLDPADHAALFDWTLAHEASFVPSRVGQARLDPALRNSLSLRDPAAFAPWRELLRERLAPLLPDACAALGIQPFDLGRIEVQLLAYGDGAYYRRHVDIARNGQSVRVISGVYYFHSEPKAWSGGELRLFPVAGDDHVDVVPRQNLLLLFPAWAPHEARTVQCSSRRFADSRFAINLWLHLARTEQGPPPPT